MSHAICFAYRGPSLQLFLPIHVDTTGIIWDRGKFLRLWQIFFAKDTARRTNGYGSRCEEPNLELACLDHGHVSAV